jgi:peptide/nickel transport system ATP-binding protein
VIVSVTPVLQTRALARRYRREDRAIAAVDGIDLTIAPGETLGLVGPSGSGKSTLARLVMALEPPDAGSVAIDGQDLATLTGPALRQLRRRWTMVFQDPLAAFNPRANVASAIADPLRIHRLPSGPERIAELLAQVHLSPTLTTRAIHEISGGQRQRVALARALATRPAQIVLDEAVSALDATVRAEILRLRTNQIARLVTPVPATRPSIAATPPTENAPKHPQS